MASISTNPNGYRTVQFVGGDKRRRSIRLGKVSQRAAEAVKRKVERLVEAQLTGQPLERSTADWVSRLDSQLAERLVRVGLIEPRRDAQKGVPSLEAFLAAYIGTRTDVKPLTTMHLKNSADKLIAFFGPDCKLDSITSGDADEYRLYLHRDLAPNTVRRLCGRARQFFRAAVRRKLIDENPFGDMKDCNVRGNPQREFFVTREMTSKLLEAAPDSQWRLLIALSRYGGLRCPSEHLQLRWSDVDWDRSRLTVHSPKTARHEGREHRIIPIFPELRQYLDASWDAAGDEAEFIIARYRDSKANLRTQLQRIIQRAGLKPWPKLFQNLRASRATELAAEFPAHVAAEWLGHSAIVAQRHYWRVTDTDYQKAVQNPVQKVRDSSGNETQSPFEGKPQHPALQKVAAGCDNLHNCVAPPVGDEHLQFSSRETVSANRGGAESGAVAQLSQVLEELPAYAQLAILELIRSISG